MRHSIARDAWPMSVAESTRSDSIFLTAPDSMISDKLLSASLVIMRRICSVASVGSCRACRAMRPAVDNATGLGDDTRHGAVGCERGENRCGALAVLVGSTRPSQAAPAALSYRRRATSSRAWPRRAPSPSHRGTNQAPDRESRLLFLRARAPRACGMLTCTTVSRALVDLRGRGNTHRSPRIWILPVSRFTTIPM